MKTEIGIAYGGPPQPLPVKREYTQRRKLIVYSGLKIWSPLDLGVRTEFQPRLVFPRPTFPLGGSQLLVRRDPPSMGSSVKEVGKSGVACRVTSRRELDALCPGRKRNGRVRQPPKRVSGLSSGNQVYGLQSRSSWDRLGGGRKRRSCFPKKSGRVRLFRPPGASTHKV